MEIPGDWIHGDGEADLYFFKDWPKGFVEFYSKTNGGQGYFGENYVDFIKQQNIEIENEAIQVKKFAPGFKIFAFNGGNEAFAVNLSNKKIVALPMVGMSPDELLEIGDDLEDFIEKLSDGSVSI